MIISSLTDGNWHHYCAVRYGNFIRTYYDGVEIFLIPAGSTKTLGKYYYYYYYYHHILTGYPRHRSVFQWGPAVKNYYIT